MTIGEEGIHSESDLGSAFYRWCAFFDLKETARLFLLRMSAGTFLILPKRALPEGTDLPGLRLWISSRVNSQALEPAEHARQTPGSDEPLRLPRLNFNLTISEFSRARRSQTNYGWKWLAVQAAQTAWIVVLVLVVLRWRPDLFWPSVGVAVVGSMLAQLVANGWVWRRQKMLRGAQSVEISESGLRFIKDGQVQRLGWGAWVRYTRDKELFVLTARDGSMRVIPLRAFVGGDDAAEFERLLRDRVRSGVGFTVVPAAKAS